MDDQVAVAHNLCLYLQKGISPILSERKSAEVHIANMESKDGYSPLLLSMIAGEIGCEYISDNIKLPLVLTFKNFFKKNYKLNEKENLMIIPENDINFVRKNIIRVSLSLPTPLSYHLDTTIGIIAKKDFPNSWPSFLNEIVSIMSTCDIEKCTRLLKIIHGAFKKYRYEFKSNELWMEIKYVIDVFGPIFINLLNHAQKNITLFNVSVNKTNLINIQFVIALMDCYHDLISQEIPDYFVENLDMVMKFIFHYLSSEISSNATINKEDLSNSVIIKLKTRLIQLIILFLNSYEDDIRGYLPEFIKVIYQMAVTLPKTDEYDKLNIAIIKFLSTIPIRPQSKEMISDLNTLNNICCHVIIPNACIRENEIETFEDDPTDYILKDIESADYETKRKAIKDFIRQLITSYGDTVVNILNDQINQLITSSFVFDENSRTVKIGNWINIDLAVYLIMSSAIINESPRIGPTTLCSKFDINAIFQKLIHPLLAFVNVIEYPILKADALKYMHVFRNFINLTLVESVVPSVLNHLANCNSIVIISYIFIVLSDLLTYSTINNQPLTKDEIDHRRNFLLTHFSSYYKYLLPTQKDNIYQLKWMIKWLNYFNKALSIEFIQIVADRLTSLIDSFEKVNASPEFIHLCFEAVCLILWLCKCVNNVNLEDTEIRLLNVTINQIVQNNSNTIGYAFQVYSLFLKLFSKEKLSSVYIQHYSLFLAQELWICKSNVPGLCQIMNSYLMQFSNLYTSEVPIKTIIDLFKYCLSLHHMDGMSVSLAKNIVINLPYDFMKPKIPEIFSLCFKRLAIRRTYRYTQDLISFIFQFIALHGFKEFKVILDTLDNELFSRFINRILIVEISKPIHSPLFKKLLITLSLIILEQSIDYCLSSDPNLWWSLLKCTLESITFNKTLIGFDSNILLLQDDNTIDNDIDTIDHVTEDESFNKLTYAFVTKLPFSGDVYCGNRKTISSSTLSQYNLKPIIQKIFDNSTVRSHILDYISSDTIQQIQAQLLAQN